jgi:hypothetical protein
MPIFQIYALPRVHSFMDHGAVEEAGVFCLIVFHIECRNRPRAPVFPVYPFGHAIGVHYRCPTALTAVRLQRIQNPSNRLYSLLDVTLFGARIAAVTTTFVERSASVCH